MPESEVPVGPRLEPAAAPCRNEDGKTPSDVVITRCTKALRVADFGGVKPGNAPARGRSCPPKGDLDHYGVR
jgi:hypothetical protein